jgi:hypothetical protein
VNLFLKTSLLCAGAAFLLQDYSGASVAAIAIPFLLWFHEKGHYWQAKKLGLNPTISWKHLITIYDDCSLKDENKVLVAGLLAGYVPIILLLPWMGWWTFALVYIYSLGCASDIKQARKNKRVMNQ